MRWETGQQYNIGVDLSMFDARLSVTMDYYSKYTNDMILTIDLPVYAQFPSSPKANMGSMVNNGFEITASWDDVIGDFRYGITANLSTYKSVVRSLGGNPEYWSGDVSRSIVGEEFGRFYMLEYLGIFQTQEEIDTYVNSEGRMIQPLAQPGDFKFADHDGDGQITDNDRVFMGTPQPKASVGLNLSFGYRNLDLSLFFTGVFGNQIFNQPKGFYGKLQRNNITQDLYENSWRQAGDDAKYPRVTATDLNNKFAVDVFAKKNGCFISDMNLAKEVSAALLAGKEVGFASDFPWLGEVPEELKLLEEGQEKPELGIYVTNGYMEHPFVHTLYLIPRVITTGVGCKKETPKEIVEKVIRRACDEQLIPSVAMEQVASIDLKKDEEGILEYCEERNLPFVTYSKEELEEVEGTYASSSFVKDVTGVDNVCERAALLGSSKEGKGRLILRKFAQDGVTVALAMKKWSVNFE